MASTNEVYQRCFKESPYFEGQSLDEVLLLLRDRPSLRTQRALYGVKQYWLETTPRRAPKPPCAIIDCFSKPAIVLNSLSYCLGHRGLALLHAMRHD